jgi:hypothetical protein
MVACVNGGGCRTREGDGAGSCAREKTRPFRAANLRLPGQAWRSKITTV